MRAGFCAVDITPNVGSPLNGFIARVSPSIGLDLALYVRALVMDSEDCRCLIVGFDVLGLSPDFADRLVLALSRRAGIAADHIVLSSSHTHSGPMTAPLRGIGAADEAYLQLLEVRACEAAFNAIEKLQPVTVSWGTAPVDIGINRREIREPEHTAVLGRNPAGPCDRAVRVLHLKSEQRSCILFEHACHPYCLGPEHPLISPDFWGHAADVLVSAGYDTIYLNGCAGDIAPHRAFGGPQAARQTGGQLAEAVLAACSTAKVQPDPVLRAGSVDVRLPYDQLPPLPEIERSLRQPNRTVRDEDGANQAVQSKVQAAWQEWFTELSRAIHANRLHDGVRGRISVLRIGDGAIVALPGEAFYAIGERIAAGIKASPACMAAYCHGFIGYVPDAQAFRLGGYEVEESHRYLGLWRVSPGSEDILKGHVTDLWKRLGGELR